MNIIRKVGELGLQLSSDTTVKDGCYGNDDLPLL